MGFNSGFKGLMGNRIPTMADTCTEEFHNIFRNWLV